MNRKNTNSLKNTLLLCAFSCVSLNTSYADETIFKPYIGLDVAYTRLDGASGYDSSLGSYKIKNTDFVSVGGRFGVDIADYFGLEGRAGIGLRKGRVSVSSQNFNHTNLDLKLKNYVAGFGKLQTPSYHGFRAYGLAGISYAEVQASLSGVKETENDTSFAWGLGTSYNFTQNWGLNLEYLELQEDTNSINLGATYHF